jgi:hypothetical protein
MKNNMAERRTKNIFTVFSSLYIYSSIFEYDNHNLTIDSSGLNVYFGGFINLGVASLAYIQSSNFVNGEAYSGGAIYVSSET